MASRKRPSDTTVVVAAHDDNNNANNTRTNVDGGKPWMTDDPNVMKNQSKSRLKVKILRYHAVAKWTWNAGSEDEVCGICQSAFEGVAPGVKYPGDECPVVFGKCGHAFHLQCVSTWLNSSRNTCPMCRREWEFGQSSDQRRIDSN